MIDTPLPDWPGCHLKFFSSDLAWTCWKMIDLPFLVRTSGGSPANSTFACTSPMMHGNVPQTFSPSADSHLKMLIYCIFSFKCRIESGCHALNIVGNPIIDINAKPYISEFKMKSWKDDWSPLVLTDQDASPGNCFSSAFSSGHDAWKMIDSPTFSPSVLRAIWWKSWKLPLCWKMIDSPSEWPWKFVS